MAGAASDYLENVLINATLRGVTFPAISSLYVALFTAAPTDANITANEVQGSWYARQDAAAGGALSGAFAAPVNGVTSNSNLLSFPSVTDASVTVTHYGIYDAATGGNLLVHGALGSPKTALEDDVLSFAQGSIQITVT